MSTYAIGDVQGCYEPLKALLAKIRFKPDADRLWFAGDLVNRGPHSLDVLRFVRDLADNAVSVLGNHDLHLIATARGYRKPSKKDTLSEILNADDRDELLAWLQRQPLMHEEHGFAMVHAGLPPAWTMGTARRCANELQATLRSDKKLEAFLPRMYGDDPRHWRDDLTGSQRLRYITNAFTRLRYVRADGGLDFEEKRPPGAQPSSLVPWYAAAGRKSEGHAIVFGHWATLRLETPLPPHFGVFHLDTGCVWGGRLSALRLEDRVEFSVAGLRH